MLLCIDAWLALSTLALIFKAQNVFTNIWVELNSHFLVRRSFNMNTGLRNSHLLIILLAPKIFTERSMTVMLCNCRWVISVVLCGCSNLANWSSHIHVMSNVCNANKLYCGIHVLMAWG